MRATQELFVLSCNFSLNQKLFQKKKKLYFQKTALLKYFFPPLCWKMVKVQIVFSFKGVTSPKHSLTERHNFPTFYGSRCRAASLPQLRSGCDKACRTGSGPLEASGDRGMESPSPGPELRRVGFLPPSFPSIPRPHPGSLCAV